ncbi:hypothetical protein MKEN_00784200 [Mycena kentingensis (nom. inval.)]|nr:hypothetical protein MKEN_00784200 [Mycena kentingensis (nom. inval.)]
MTFLELPNEILELVVVNVAALDPNGVAAILACNRRLHELVQSFWRDIFLAVFDDPRSAATSKALPGEHTAATSTFDWTAFTRRIGASTNLKKDNPETDFVSLLNVIETAAPVSFEEELEAPQLSRAVVFPPLLKRRNTIRSESIAWVEQTIAAYGYPSELLQRYLRPLDPDGPSCRRPEFEDSEQGRAFSKLVFLHGFRPDKSDGAPGESEQLRVARVIARSRVYNTKYTSKERLWGPYQPLDPRKPDAFLWRKRLHRPSKPNPADETATGFLRASSGARYNYHVHPSSIVLSPVFADDDDEDAGDPDYNPDDSDSETEDQHTPHLLLQFLTQHGVDFADDARHPTYIFPAPHRVIPDYSFLAAARIVMEANIRDIYAMHERNLARVGSTPAHAAANDVGVALKDMIEAMQSLDLTRMGGAPGFWQVWRPEVLDPPSPLEDVAPVPVDKGKGKEKAKEQEAYQGWDWAGVEGEWRRVVSWLDYRDLLMHNVDIPSISFGREDLQETIRIFPMTLRIVRYEPPPQPPHGADPNDLIYRLPIIHVLGGSRGSDSDDVVQRVVCGTVRMIGGGAVRWAMTSGVSLDEPEWVTECVQIGGLGSAIGIMGTWTGCEHSTTDPIGPCWAWKISK